MRPTWALHAMAPLAVAAAWTAHLPLGAKYVATLALATAALGVVTSQHRWRELLSRPPTRWMGALLVLLAISGWWSPAPAAQAAGHWGQYALMLVVPLVGLACPGIAARRALAHLVLASVLASAIFAADAAGVLPPAGPLWHTTVHAEGNQRIAGSMLLALSAALALWLGSTGPRAWWLAALACCIGLALQDRRSGLLLLPLLLLVLAWRQLRRPGPRLAALAALAIGAAVVVLVSGGVRARLSEGLSELHGYRATDQVTTSWGQRLRMWQHSTGFVAERPLLGHGLGSWRPLWRHRVEPGTLLALNTTPHNEYLLLAVQGGLVALALWLGVLRSALGAALRAGAPGMASLLTWTTIAAMGLVHAALRDAKLALPLLLAAGLAAAVARGDDPPPAR